MRSIFLTACLAASAAALAIVQRDATTSEESGQLYTIELAPGETRQVTEAEKWKLKSEGVNFMDITEFPDLGQGIQRRAVPTYPAAMAQTSAVNALLPKLTTTNMKSNLQTFSDFNNRYYKATTGRDSSVWLQKQVQSIIDASGAKNVSVAAFAHSFIQSSVIATIPGKTTKLVILGAHQDSINQRSPTSGRAPGADDDGSGTMTILEAFRVLLTDSRVASNQQENTIEFHFYAAEEGGLLGSQAIYSDYSKKGKNVVAFLQQDMTGYTKGTIDAGKKVNIGLLTDYVDKGLTAFVKKVIAAYTNLPSVDSTCGYACSDHASANKAGYPAAQASESGFDEMSPLLHTEKDTIDTVDFDHMLQHARMTVGFAIELGFATL